MADDTDLSPEELAQFGTLFGETDTAEVVTEEVPDGEPEPDDPPVSDEPDDPATQGDTPAAAAPPPALDYESDANPYRQAALEREQQLARVRDAFQAAQARKAEQERLTAYNAWLDQQSDGDPYVRRQLDDQIQAAQQPWQQRVQATESEVEQRARMVVALMTAAETELDPDTYARLQQRMEELSVYDSPDTMVQTAQRIREHKAELAARDAELAKYKKQLAAQKQAKARIASGADTADGATGGVAPTSTRERNKAEDWFFQQFGYEVSDDELGI